MAREKRGFVEGHDEGIGKSDFAGMPTELMMKQYPKARQGRDANIDDSMSDIDSVEDQGASRRNRYLSNQK